MGIMDCLCKQYVQYKTYTCILRFIYLLIVGLTFNPIRKVQLIHDIHRLVLPIACPNVCSPFTCPCLPIFNWQSFYLIGNRLSVIILHPNFFCFLAQWAKRGRILALCILKWNK